MYFRGTGVGQDFEQATSWYEKAASSSPQGVMSILGLMSQIVRSCIECTIARAGIDTRINKYMFVRNFS